MMRLRSVLRERNEALFREVEHQIQNATPQLWHSYATFPSGTKHTPEHTHMVETIAGWLLPDRILLQLGDDEIGFLILACHYHDLGMVGTEEDNLTADSRDRVRREHAVSIGDRILEHWQSLGFRNETTAEILAAICKGHRPKRVSEVATWENLPQYRILGPGRDIRVRLISAIVYAADELHIGEDRAPRREEEFNKIVSVESRQHWRRHQSIQGPVVRDGQLCFEASPGTPWFEGELRKSLKKAFQSLADLAGELNRSEIGSAPADVRLRWNRPKIWKLLAAIAASDLRGRSVATLADEVQAIYTTQSADHQSIAHLCTEEASAAPLREEVEEAIRDLITREFLVPAGGEAGEYVLDGLPRTTDHLFRWTRQADELDLLFQAKDSPGYEHRLYRSEFGRRYIRDALHPHLVQDYHIDIVEMPHDEHVKAAIEYSPTAARIAQLLPLPPTVLVQTDLLALATAAGTCTDLLNDPEMVLDSQYRRAVTGLFTTVAKRLPEFLMFIEELAIIKKLTVEQVFDAIKSSEPASDHYREDSSVSFQLSQNFPVARPDWSLGYLMLASQRAEVSITVQNTHIAPFHFRPPKRPASPEEESDERPVALTIGPAQPRLPKTMSFRASASLDEQRSTLTIRAFTLSSNEFGKPLLFQFSPKESGVARCALALVLPELTVGDIVVFRNAQAFQNAGELVTDVTLEERAFGQLDASLDVSPLSEGLYDELVTRLAEYDPTTPLPLYLERMYRDRLTSCGIAELASEVAAVFAERERSRPTLTTIFMRFANVEGRDYYEEFLGVQPPNFGFRPPTIVAESVSQEDIDEKWNAGAVDFGLEMSFREDMFELSQTLRDWVADKDKPFPFRYDGNSRFHYARTRLSISFDKVIDRKWYLERRATFRFRPVTKAERYAAEAEYWKSVGDSERAELLSELLCADSAGQVVPEKRADESTSDRTC